jgi:uncharacterized delta-60 repeat protein
MWFFSPRNNRFTRPARRPGSPRPRLEVLEDRCVPSTTGYLDTTFGTPNGYVLSNPNPSSSSVGNSVAVQPDGKIVVVGDAANSRGYDSLAVFRYNPDGTPDNSFGSGGVALTTLTGKSGYHGGQSLTAVALQADGKIVVAGGAPVGSTGEFAVAGYLASGPRIGSFSASPNPVTAGANLMLTASSVSEPNPSGSVTQVAFYYLDSSGNQQLLGYGTQTSPGVWTFTFTVNLAPESYTLFAQAEDNYGLFSDPLTSSMTVQ